jgi:hypothetical protein
MIQKYGLTPTPLKGSKKESPQPLKGGKSSLPICIGINRARGHFWWLWYPFRWWVGVKGVIKLIKNP